MLERELKYFTEHKDELISKYKGKYIAIVGEDIIGVHDTQNEAFIATSKNHKAGTFLIKLCDIKMDSHTQTFHSRVSFA